MSKSTISHMNRYVATSILATATGMFLVFAVHGCTLNPYAGYSREEAKEELSGGGSTTSTSSTTSSSSGNPGCKCAADGNDCTDDLPVGDACPGADEASCHTMAPAKPCTDVNGNPAFCDAAGMCTPCNECSDANCAHRCVGQACAGPANCANGLCVDGFCCNTDCTGECNACNRVPGECEPLPVGMVGDCEAGQYCGNTNSCTTALLGVVGSQCSLAANCASGACVGQLCVSLDGQPCVENLECASRLCDAAANKCIPCGQNAPCPGGGTCGNGTCQALLGQPAKTTSECKSPGMVHDGLTCTLPIGAMCTNNFECIYHDCNMVAGTGTCAMQCKFDAECPNGTNCNMDKGWCLLPSGSFCVIDDQCQGPMNTVGKCTGFPRRCQ